MDALKIVSFIRRRTDLSLEQFSAYWRTIHKEHALALVRAGFFRGYIQNHAFALQPDGLERIADGSPELWIDDLAALERLLASPEYREGAGPDEANFIVPPAIAGVARERVLVGGVHAALPATAVKLMLAVSRPSGLARAAFTTAWLEGTNNWWSVTAAPLRLSRQAFESETADAEADVVFDGVECSWWRDVDSACRAWSSVAATVASATAAVHGLLVAEEVVLPPPY